MLPGMWDDVVVLAGSPHAHVRACWIPAHPCPCPLDPRMHTLTAYACTHTLGPCMHAPGPCTHAPGPCTLAHTGSPCPLGLHARTGSPCPLARGVPMQARTGPCMHARTGPCTFARTGPPCPLSLHARMHQAHAHVLAPGPHTRSLAGSPCTCICVHWMHHVCIPQLCIGRVVCSSSYV
jgi:hypothetical protein